MATNSQNIKLYRYLPSYLRDNLRTPPVDLDYRSATNSRLHPKRTILFGELIRVSYFGEAEKEFSDLILSEDFRYHRDAQNYAEKRDLWITYFKENNFMHPVQKHFEKFYDEPKARIVEAKRRRENVVDQMRGAMMGSELEAPLQALLDRYVAEVQAYLEASTTALAAAVAQDDSSEASWLDYPIPQDPRFTFRQYIPVELSRAYTGPVFLEHGFPRRPF